MFALFQIYRVSIKSHLLYFGNYLKFMKNKPWNTFEHFEELLTISAAFRNDQILYIFSDFKPLLKYRGCRQTLNTLYVGVMLYINFKKDNRYNLTVKISWKSSLKKDRWKYCLADSAD